MMNEHMQLRDSIATFLSKEGPVSHLRKLRDSADPLSMSPQLWQMFADMGYAGMLVDEAFGGIGMSLPEACIVMESIGRHLTPSPFFSTAVLCAVAIEAFGSRIQRSAYLPKIAQAGCVMTLATQESAKYDPHAIAATARLDGGLWRIAGEKTFVVDGHSADTLIVAARTSGAVRDPNGITLFLVDTSQTGVARERTALVDHHGAARIAFGEVLVGGDAVLGEVDHGGDALTHVGQVAAIATAAEMIGLGAQALRMTLDYLKERRQFNALIGEFQALQHRAAKMYVELELARLAVDRAAEAFASHEPIGLYAAVAKAKATAASGLIVREAVQMHGGIGVTDEYDLGFFMKRQRALAESFGDDRFHLDALATLTGY